MVPKARAESKIGEILAKITFCNICVSKALQIIKKNVFPKISAWVVLSTHYPSVNPAQRLSDKNTNTITKNT